MDICVHCIEVRPKLTWLYLVFGPSMECPPFSSDWSTSRALGFVLDRAQAMSES